MVSLQAVFDRIQVAKKESKEIRAIYRDALASSVEYQQVIEELEKISEKKKTLVEGIKSDFRPEFDRLEELQISIADDRLLMSDLALNAYLKGEKLELTDERQAQYEPIFNVQFKKVQ